MQTIDPKHIKSANEHNGRVFVRYGVFEPREEKEVIKEPIPILGKIFPFLKRKRTITKEKKDLVVKEEDVSLIRLRNMDNKLFKKLAEIPYDKIIALDPKVYGPGLYVTVSLGKIASIHDIVTEKGVVIGRFDMAGKGYYSPDLNCPLLPKEASESMDRHQACEPVSLTDAISNYCAENADAAEHIPESVHNMYPDLKNDINKKVEKQPLKQTFTLEQ